MKTAFLTFLLALTFIVAACKTGEEEAAGESDNAIAERVESFASFIALRTPRRGAPRACR